MRSILMALLCFVSLGACASDPPPDLAALGQQILDAEAEEAAGWKARDVDAIIKVYSPEVVVLLGGAAPMDREKLRGLFVNFLADPGFMLTFRSDPPLMSAAGDIGTTVGTYTITYTDPETKAIGKKTGHHLMTWQRQEEGAWRVVRQMTVHDR